MEVKHVRPSLTGSVERACHDAGDKGVGFRFLLDLREGQNNSLRRCLLDPLPERFIGVIYRPETERFSHYADASLSRQFDAYVWFDETSAVTPLDLRHGESGTLNTYPFGV